MLRKQRILRYKYSKAIRRRQLWDRNPLHNTLRPTWGWQTPGQPSTNDGLTLSSAPSLPYSDTSQKPIGQGISDDFAHFKACVDKDPFGAVFGRRLVSHGKATDASWSAFSWIFDSTPPEEGQRISHKAAVCNTPPTPRPSSISSSDTRTASRPSGNSPDTDDRRTRSTLERPATANNSADQNDEYEFDPISMRKVLKSKPMMETQVKASKPLFDALFAEKGVDIPVKPYKPHRVFGYSAKSSSNRSDSKIPSPDSRVSNPKPETSRLAELRKLKAATLGNSIDTTAEYHGKWFPPAEKAEKKHIEEHGVRSTAPEAPLFSGTTYEEKYKDFFVKEVKDFKQDWLDREGFGTKQESSVDGNQDGGASKANIEHRPCRAKHQSSMDRLDSVHRTSDKLEPSLNRLASSSKKTASVQSSQKPRVAPYKAQDPSHEDLDQLRASDIRASTRTSRRIKEDGEKTKEDQREKPENDFRSHQEDDGISVALPNLITESSKKLSESLNNLWHRVRAQQKAWLIHKAESLGSAQDSIVDSPLESGSSKKPERPVGEVKAPSNVQKAGGRPIQTFTPSQEVLDAEEENKNRTLALRKASLEFKKSDAEVKEKEKALAREIKETYEDEYGQITVHHRQIHRGLARIAQLAEANNEGSIRTDRTRVTDLVALYEDALWYAKRARVETMQKLQAIRARLESSKATLPLPPWEITSYLRSVQPVSKGSRAVEDSPDKATVEDKQTSSISPEASRDRAPLMYKVLAYDSSTLQMNIAETTSSTSATGDSESQPLHPTEVLSRLNNVAKFLPYFADMEKKGYEMVSGSGDVLVFKGVRAPTYPSNTTTKSSNAFRENLPRTSTPSIQGPTPAESVVEAMAPNTSSSKVRREEDVFSGSGQTWHQEEGSSNTGAEPGWFRKTVRRIFLAGTLTAIMAYSIGAMAEHAGAQVQEVRPRRSGRPGLYSTEDSR